jgi:hypothetical protein
MVAGPAGFAPETGGPPVAERSVYPDTRIRPAFRRPDLIWTERR